MLLPCPFCGAPAEERSPDYETEVHCTECAAKVEAAPEFWNRRAAPVSERMADEDKGLCERLTEAAKMARCSFSDQLADLLEEAATLIEGQAALIGELGEALRAIDALPVLEINVCNYDHDDVCELNHNAVQAALIARAALAKLETDARIDKGEREGS